VLDELEPWELVEWKAAREILPLDDGWKQAGTIAADAHNDFEHWLAIKAGRSTIAKSRWRKPEDYIPRREPEKLEAIEIDQASIDAHQAAIESRYLRDR
jgi:hypothetical protein